MTAKERSDKNHDMHRKLWGLLAEHPSMGKETAFVCFLGLPQNARPVGDCYACEEAKARQWDADNWPSNICRFCPIESWAENDEYKIDETQEYDYCQLRHSLYQSWKGAEGERRAELAKRIADLKWTDPEEEEA